MKLPTIFIVIASTALIVLTLNASKIYKTVKETVYVSQPEVKKDLLLPDLLMLPPRDFYITSSNNTRFLRFTSTFGNQGKGAFEAIGHTDEEKKITYAHQYVRSTDGAGQF